MSVLQHRHAMSKRIFICLSTSGSALAIMFSTPANALLTTVSHDTQVSISFELPTIPPNSYDTLSMGFWDGGRGSSVIPTDSASLYDGTTLLGTSTILPHWGSSFGWVSPSSQYSTPGAQISTINFSSISNGSIDGTIVYQPGSGRSVTIDTRAAIGQPYSIYLALGIGSANGGLLASVPGSNQPVISGVSFSPVGTTLPPPPLPLGQIYTPNIAVALTTPITAPLPSPETLLTASAPFMLEIAKNLSPEQKAFIEKQIQDLSQAPYQPLSSSTKDFFNGTADWLAGASFVADSILGGFVDYLSGVVSSVKDAAISVIKDVALSLPKFLTDQLPTDNQNLVRAR